MGNHVKVREAHEQNLGETGYLHLDGRWITSIAKHNVGDMYHIELAATRDDRPRSLVEYGSTMIEYTPDAPAQPAHATDAAAVWDTPREQKIANMKEQIEAVIAEGGDAIKARAGLRLVTHAEELRGELAEATARAGRAEGQAKRLRALLDLAENIIGNALDRMEYAPRQIKVAFSEFAEPALERIRKELESES